MNSLRQALSAAIEEQSVLKDSEEDLYSQMIDMMMSQQGVSYQEAKEQTDIDVSLAKQTRTNQLSELHKARLTEAWLMVLADSGKYYGPEMKSIAKYMLDIVLGDNPLTMMTPKEWEHKYHLVTRQVDINNPLFGATPNKPMWTGNDGLSKEVPMGELWHKKGGGTFASGYNIQIKGGRAMIVHDAMSGFFNIHTPIGWQLAKTSMTFPVEWLYPTAINGMMVGMKWHRISTNTADGAKFANHITDKSSSAKGNPAKSVDILSGGMFLYRLWIVANNKALLKGFMDSRAGGGFTCMNVAYRYGKNDSTRSANGERCALTILPKEMLSADASKYQHEQLLKIGAVTGEFKLYHAFPQKPELTLEGAWQCDGKDNIYIVRNAITGAWWTNQQKNGNPAVNKVCARNDKLIIGGRKVAPIGKWKILVLKDVPKELEKLFSLGNFLMCADEVRRIGITRCLTENGNIKGVGLPWQLLSTGYKAVNAKSSWKSDGNGVLAMHADGMNKERQLAWCAKYLAEAKLIDIQQAVANTPEGDVFDIADAVRQNVIKNNEATKKSQQLLQDRLDKLPTVKVLLPGVPGYLQDCEVEGWEVEDEMYASNLYCTYGVRQVGEIANDGTDEEQEQNGFFTEAFLGFCADKAGYSPIAALHAGLKAKKYSIKKPKTQIKATDFMSVAKSYGVGPAKALIDAAIKQQMEGKSVSKRKVIQDIMLHGYGNTLPVCSMDVFKTICPILFVDGKGKALQPSAANYNQVDRYDLTNERWSLLVDGSEKLGWPGLRNSHGMIIKQGNLSFYVPPWSVFNKDLDEDTIKDASGEERIVRYLGESWTQLVVLMKAAYTPQAKYEKKTNWVLSHANYMARINQLVLEDVMSKLDVKGRYYTILPKWWDNAENSVVCTDSMWHHKDKEIEQVLYMKNPALFSNAIVNMFISKWLPDYWLPTDKYMLLALSAAIFVDVEFMLKHQDDCDGDQAVIMDLGGILPEDHGTKPTHDVWCAEYIADEKKLAVSIKAYTPIDMVQMHDGIIHSAAGKRDTGIMTQNFFNVMLYTEMYMYEHPNADKETVRLIVEAFATGVQDEAVRQIKQESHDGVKFFDDAALYANPHLPMFSENRRVSDEEVVVFGRVNKASRAIYDRIINKFFVGDREITDKQRSDLVKSINLDTKLLMHIVESMMLTQSFNKLFRGTEFKGKAAAHWAYIECGDAAPGNKNINDSRIGCLFSSRYWENTCKTAPQFGALNNEKAARAYATLMAFDLPAKDKAEAYKNAKAKAKYIAANPILVEQAHQYGWAKNFTSCDKTRAGWYKYNTWLSADGTDISMWEGSTFGYMLGQLKVAYSFNPPKRPVGKKTVVKPIEVSQEHSAGIDALFAEMEAAIVVDNYDINVENIKKFVAMYHCKLELSATHVVINGELLSNNDVRAYSVENLRGVLRSLVAKLGLSREVPVVTYPTVFRTKDNDLLGVGSYVLHNKLNYMVYGFTKTGKAKLVGLMTDDSLKVKAAGVEAAELVVKANFPMVDSLMIVKPTLAIDSKGKFVQPTDEQLKAAYLICNS